MKNSDDHTINSNDSYSQRIQRHVQKSMEEEVEIRKREQLPEFGATVIKSVANLAPIFGGTLVECLNFIIPNRRFDRFMRFVYELEARLILLEETIPRDEIQRRMTQPEFERLLEEGSQQASRTLSDERRARLASLLKNGLSDEDQNYPKHERVLDVLGQLNDVELLILEGYFVSWCDYEKGIMWWDKHEALNVQEPYIGSKNDEYEAYALSQSYTSHLQMLHLLEMDKPTDNSKARPHITLFGRMFIFALDLHLELENAGYYSFRNQEGNM
jgi:hypothetical protein